MKNFVKVLVLALGLSTVGLVHAKDVKMGIINGADIAEKYQADIEKKIADKFKTQESELRSMQEQLKEMGERVKRDQAVMSESELDKLKKEFEEKQKTYQTKGMAYGEQINKERNDAFEKLLNAVNDEIAKVAKQKGYDIILQKAATAYTDGKNDITKEVLEGLEKSKPLK